MCQDESCQFIRNGEALVTYASNQVPSILQSNAKSRSFGHAAAETSFATPCSSLDEPVRLILVLRDDLEYDGRRVSHEDTSVPGRAGGLCL